MKANLPSGTVTFLFTDIEGSTRLARAHKEAWETLRARHHDILREAIESNHGYVFQIIGDAFCAAFHTAGDALRAAARSQIDLHAENWGAATVKVRMGIHTGKAEVQENGEYHGYLAMSRIQRLMSAGHGGQVLISAATQELLLEDLPEGVSLRDLGERRLKDLIRPEHVYQLVIPDLPVEFPPLKTLDLYRHNLPVQLTSFIGREQEMEEIKGAILTHRLVTLTGSGGTGKTRLILQVAADLLDQFADGVWFVELASLTNPNLIPETILSAMGIPEKPGMTVRQLLLDYLRERNVLLVLDNCEHLVQACAEIADTLLSNSSNLKIMATSREALGIQGELIWHVPSLSLPDVKQLPSIEQLSQYEAVRLFIERAALVQPHFLVTNENAPAVAQICFRLDGIPLAIELAAARVRALEVEQIARRLDDRFRLLTGGSRTALERQQTLRATIDWSYNLLSPGEKLLLGRLSVFSGGWTLEAAEQVCVEEGSDLDVLDLLTHLVDKSLVILDGSRYRMLETTRQYARQKLDESGEESMRYRHLVYFLRLAEFAESQLTGPEQTFWLNLLEREHDNLRSALGWSIQAGRDEEALRTAGALGMFWFKHTHYSEGRNWYKKILDRNWSESAQARVKAWRFAGVLARWQKDTVEARRIFTENLERERELGDQWGFAFSLHMLGNIAELEGDIEQARECHKKSIALSSEVGAIWVLAMTQIGLGYLEHTQGNLGLAEEMYNESLKHCRQLGEKWGINLILANLGYLVYAKGDLVYAKRIFLECLTVARELGDKDGMIMAIAGLSSIFPREGGYITSARLQGVVVAKGKEIGTSLYPVEQEVFDLTAEALKETMGVQAYRTEFDTGMTLTLDEAVRLALGRN